jgi:hypothetical protein
MRGLGIGKFSERIIPAMLAQSQSAVPVAFPKRAGSRPNRDHLMRRVAAATTALTALIAILLISLVSMLSVL